MDEDGATQEERLAELKTRHRELDEEIAQLSDAGGANALRLQSLKKQKLALKDVIARIESSLLPDIIA